MKVIDVPKPFKPNPEKEPDNLFTFEDFLVGAIGQDGTFASWENLDRAAIIRKKLRDMTDVLQLDDDEYKRVLDACKLSRFNGTISDKLAPYKQAFLDAQNVPTPTKT